MCDSFTKEDLTRYAEIQSLGSKVPRGRPRTRPAGVMASTMPVASCLQCAFSYLLRRLQLPGSTRKPWNAGGKGSAQIGSLSVDKTWSGTQKGVFLEKVLHRGPGPGLRTHSWGASSQMLFQGPTDPELVFTSQILTTVTVNLNGMLY